METSSHSSIIATQSPNISEKTAEVNLQDFQLQDTCIRMAQRDCKWLACRTQQMVNRARESRLYHHIVKIIVCFHHPTPEAWILPLTHAFLPQGRGFPLCTRQICCDCGRRWAGLNTLLGCDRAQSHPLAASERGHKDQLQPPLSPPPPPCTLR